VPREDVPALAAALNRVLADRDLAAALAAAGPRRVAQAFTLDAMLDGTLAVYREALGAA
jgi:glycosyltransferase involved in cell wall biosynthesis